MKPKKGAISSPLKTVDIFQTDCQMSKQIEFTLKTCKISTCPVSKNSAQRYYGRPSTRDQNQTTAWKLQYLHLLMPKTKEGETQGITKNPRWATVKAKMTTALNTGWQGSNKCLSSLFDKALFRNKHRSGVHAQRPKHQNPQKNRSRKPNFPNPTAKTRPSHVQFETNLSHRIQNTEPNSSCRINEEGGKKTLTNSDSRKTEQIETDLISILRGMWDR